MNSTPSSDWSSEQSTGPHLEGDSVSTSGFESSTESLCHVCSHVRTLPQNMFVLQLIFPAVTLLANLLTTAAIYRSRQMKASLRLNLLHLSGTDILSSLIYMYNIAFSWTQFKVNAECVVRYILFVSTQIVTLNTIVFMSIDRCVALMVPYLYSRRDEATAAKIMLGVSWMISFVNGVIGFSHVDVNAEGCFYPILFRPFTHIFWAVSGLGCIFCVIALNIIVFTKARLQISKIAAAFPAGDARTKEISRLELKSILTTVSVVIPYVLLNTPIYVLMAVFVERGPKFTHHSDALYLVNAFSSLSLLNALANPAIYVWRSEMVRAELWKIVSPLKRPWLQARTCWKRGQQREEGDGGMAVTRKGSSKAIGRSVGETVNTRVSTDSSPPIVTDVARLSQQWAPTELQEEIVQGRPEHHSQ